jgi:prolyl-tRNA synthetase
MKTYWDQYHAYEEIAKRLDLEAIPVEADSGALGGDFCHEFMVPCELGEDSIITCECGYSANTEKAIFEKENKNVDEDMQPTKEVDAIRGTTMEDGVQLHKLPLWQQIKDVMFKDNSGRYILAVIRGDYDVNEAKLAKLLGVSDFEMATDDEIRNDLNSEPGFISPVGIKAKIKSGVELIIVGDDSLRTVKNAYGGANAKNKDLLNVNIDRDYQLDIEGDIALAKEGFVCAKCKSSKFQTRKTIEFGHVFKYDDFYTKAMGCTFTDKDGKEKNLQMGAYGIGVERAMAIVVETHSDDKGIIWPASIAPYKYHLITLKSKKNDDKINKIASELYGKLGEDSVLWDEREELRAGEKFSDADLIGCPVRIVVSDKSLENGGIEVKRRVANESEILNIDTDYINKVVNY